MSTQGNNKDVAPVVAVAKERKSSYNEIVVLSTGVRAKIHGVSATLIDEVTSRIKDPLPPKIYIEDKGREDENPNDPRYLAELSDKAKERGVAALDAMVMFGVELADPIPPEKEWLPKLQMLQRMNMIDLGRFDLTDELEREFVYKRYIAVGSDDLSLIGTSVSQQEIAQAEQSFLGNQG